jgi:hypothetical protein
MSTTRRNKGVRDTFELRRLCGYGPAEPMKTICVGVLLLGASLLPAVAGEPGAATLARAKELASAMQYEVAFEESLAVCRENTETEDLEALAAKSPEIFGGIGPGDAQWPEVRSLYLAMLAKGCAYSRAPALEALYTALATALGDDDLDALIAFYDTGLGQRFVRASLVANRAATLASQRLPEADTAYEDYAAAVSSLLATSASPTNEAPDTGLAKATQAARSATEALALSDRTLQLVGQDPHSAIALLRPYSIIGAAQMDAIEDQLIDGMATAATQYGGIIDHELLRNDSIGDSLMRATFLQRRAHYGMSWQFLWYRAADGWVLSGFRFASDLGSLF